MVRSASCCPFGVCRHSRHCSLNLFASTHQPELYSAWPALYHQHPLNTFRRTLLRLLPRYQSIATHAKLVLKFPEIAVTSPHRRSHQASIQAQTSSHRPRHFCRYLFARLCRNLGRMGSELSNSPYSRSLDYMRMTHYFTLVPPNVL